MIAWTEISSEKSAVQKDTAVSMLEVEHAFAW